MFYSVLTVLLIFPRILGSMELNSFDLSQNEEERIPGEAYLSYVLQEASSERFFQDPPVDNPGSFVQEPIKELIQEPKIPYELINQLICDKKNKVTVVPEHFYTFTVANCVMFYCVIGSCKKSFSDKEKLAEHMVEHSMVEHIYCPYSFCIGTKFRAKRTLLRHLFRHLNYRPYKCQTCKSAFIQEADLTYHMDQRHPYADFRWSTRKTIKRKEELLDE